GEFWPFKSIRIMGRLFFCRTRARGCFHGVRNALRAPRFADLRLSGPSCDAGEFANKSNALRRISEASREAPEVLEGFESPSSARIVQRVASAQRALGRLRRVSDLRAGDRGPPAARISRRVMLRMRCFCDAVRWS